MRDTAKSPRDKPASSVYLPPQIREQLEKLALEIAFRRGRQISSSAVVQYLIQHYSELAKNELISGTARLKDTE